MKYEWTKYASRWDVSTWLILLVIVLGCMCTVLLDGKWVAPVILTSVFLLLVVVLLLSTYYIIDGDRLVVHQLFSPITIPIDKITEIRPTKSVLAAPATSLTHRIAIKFSERKVLKSSLPLIISPVRQKEFIAQLQSINPNIKVYETEY